MAIYRSTVREVRAIDMFYEVEANSEEEARELLEKGETISEEEVDGQFEVNDRIVMEGIQKVTTLEYALTFTVILSVHDIADDCEMTEEDVMNYANETLEVDFDNSNTGSAPENAGDDAVVGVGGGLTKVEKM